MHTVVTHNITKSYPSVAKSELQTGKSNNHLLSQTLLLCALNIAFVYLQTRVHCPPSLLSPRPFILNFAVEAVAGLP